MSLPSTTSIKQQLTALLEDKSPAYFHILGQFVAGKLSREEFEDQLKPILDAQTLLQLHNALIISIFDARSFRRPATPPPEVAKPNPRKRRRTLPYQGPDDHSRSIRSERLKRWTMTMGKHERHRIAGLRSMEPQPRLDLNEIAMDRGVSLLPERGEPPGKRLGVQLASTSRSPSNQQHIADRMNLICAQNNLGSPNRLVSLLMSLAVEVKLKQLATYALTLTCDSLAIDSIAPASPRKGPKVLSKDALHSLLTIAPAMLPNESAAAYKLLAGADIEEEPTEDEDDAAEPTDFFLALLQQRSGVTSMESRAMDTS
ncbi:hypothetical protein CYLTODRAFT_347955 [Cylindrobasidium torrendii FP15055 ss-10]|uniref:Transcriptional regulator of RNA polII, SAGA, subunit n=1 Tax=Cylindrobasidium torrendii FP15055 ss-10 TaxID=1314674 RepID=A0A0D7BJM7_9AGAR|nr:hypothetical protein CYLTODRAFT_347955 [Cylindrobasidium torrendii FP15055 ss-10]